MDIKRARSLSMAGIDDPHHMARGPCGGKILREGHEFFSSWPWLPGASAFNSA
ncbi:hypothetical protein ACRRTK_002768 [Alexandromys fortis]